MHLPLTPFLLLILGVIALQLMATLIIVFSLVDDRMVNFWWPVPRQSEVRAVRVIGMTALFIFIVIKGGMHLEEKYGAHK